MYNWALTLAVFGPQIKRKAACYSVDLTNISSPNLWKNSQFTYSDKHHKDLQRLGNLTV